jgi:hypothetical protein
MLTTWESLHFATLELVRSAPLKQRLVNAYRRHLSTIRPDRLPLEVRESFDHLVATLESVKPSSGEDAVVASVRKLSVQEADDCASLIVEIYGITARALMDLGRPSATVTHLHSTDQMLVNS